MSEFRVASQPSGPERLALDSRVATPQRLAHSRSNSATDRTRARAHTFRSPRLGTVLGHGITANLTVQIFPPTPPRRFRDSGRAHAAAAAADRARDRVRSCGAEIACSKSPQEGGEIETGTHWCIPVHPKTEWGHHHHHQPLLLVLPTTTTTAPDRPHRLLSGKVIKTARKREERERARTAKVRALVRVSECVSRQAHSRKHTHTHTRARKRKKQCVNI